MYSVRFGKNLSACRQCAMRRSPSSNSLLTVAIFRETDMRTSNLVVRLKPNEIGRDLMRLAWRLLTGNHFRLRPRPTADRCLFTAVLLFDADLRCRVSVFDIHQDFLHADVLPTKSRLYAIPPPRIPPASLSWDGAFWRRRRKKRISETDFPHKRNRPLHAPTGSLPDVTWPCQQESALTTMRTGRPSVAADDAMPKLER